MGLPLLLGLAGLASLRPRVLWRAATKPPAWLLLALTFLAWSCVTALWSSWTPPTAPQKILSTVFLGLGFATAVVASGPAARVSLAAASAAFLVTAALLTAEAATGYALNRATSPDPADAPSTDAAKGLVVLMTLSWPAIGFSLSGSGSQKLLAGGIAALAAGLSHQFGQASAWVGFYVGCAAFALAWLAPRPMLTLGFAGLTAWMLTAPFLTPVLVGSPQLAESIPQSWAARIAIWRYTCAQILERPWFGYGIDAGRAVSDQVQVGDWTIRGMQNHPHSASLQVWYETGAVGAILAAALIAYAGRLAVRAFASDRIGAATVSAMLASIGVMANVGWSLWQEWWTTTLILAIALACALSLRAAKA
jgi:O-antigen ligase